MTIEIRIEAPNAAEARQQMIGLLGDAYKTASLWREVEPDTPQESASPPTHPYPEPEPEEAETPTFREFGKAPEGKSRRTKEEIAEDEELAALVEKTGVSTDKVEAVVRTYGHAKAKDELEQLLVSLGEDREKAEANISASPEDRQDPENPEDAAQDAADEKAEVDAGRDADKPLTKDDLKDVMIEFQGKHGMPETQKRGPAIFEKALGKPPAGEAAWRLSLISDDDQKQLSAAIEAWKEAI